ncbi:hypothetical protein ABMC89_06730 [Sulfitobacter sp. HNIBRBA3233]|uniref:hypothetical protein n=1 Tax=Sulfitobacter marinivivus TaxID=3158558 RepID=UPI0032DEAC15
MRRFITTKVLCAAFCLAGAPAAAQPISWGMAQCAGVMEAMAANVSRRDVIAYLGAASKQLMDAARAQSLSEGRDPAELSQVRSAKAEEWRISGLTLPLRQDFYDWMGYCKSLSRAYDITFDRSMFE